MSTTDVLTLVSGSTTMDLLRGPIRLTQDGWAPATTRTRTSQLGNQSIYEPTDEEMELEIVAASGDNPGRLWGTLQQILDESRRWANGEPDTSPAYLRCRPAGSRLSGSVYLQAVVLGGEAPNLHTSFTRMLESNTVAGERVTIRRGVWYQPTTQTDNGSALASQQVQTIGYSDAPPVLSPLDVAIVPQSFASGLGDPGVRGVVLFGVDDPCFRIVDLTTATSGGWTTVTATNSSRGGNYIRYTPGSATTSKGPFTYASTLPVLDGFGVATPYLLAKTNSGGIFQVRLAFSSSIFDEPTAIFYTEYITISGTTALPYAFAPVPSYYAHDTVTIEVVHVTGTGGSLDMDTLVLHEDQGPLSYAVQLAEGAFLVDTSGAGGYTALSIYNGPQWGVAPIVAQTESSDPFGGVIRYQGYVGDAAVHISQDMLILPLLTGGTDGAFFVPSTGSAQTTFTVQTQRRKMHLTVE